MKCYITMYKYNEIYLYIFYIALYIYIYIYIYPCFSASYKIVPVMTAFYFFLLVIFQIFSLFIDKKLLPCYFIQISSKRNPDLYLSYFFKNFSNNYSCFCCLMIITIIKITNGRKWIPC